jgi:hypothetical protein
VRRRAALVALVLVLGVGGACSSDQDPGLVPEDGNDGPSTTSHLLEECSAAPDAAIPPGGCLDADGNVVRPGDTP